MAICLTMIPVNHGKFDVFTTYSVDFCGQLRHETSKIAMARWKQHVAKSLGHPGDPRGARRGSAWWFQLLLCFLMG